MSYIVVISPGVEIPSENDLECPNCGHQCESFVKEFRLNKYSQCGYQKTEEMVAQASCPKCFCVWQIIPE